ncbi:MAG: DNA glycosylase AlkZ-like family protein [Sulfobacillus sp.]
MVSVANCEASLAMGGQGQDLDQVLAGVSTLRSASLFPTSARGERAFLLEISREAARRYLLGRQGLWPGRRWSGKEGAAAALHALGAVQMDPVALVHRSHDLVLLSRVTDYHPSQLDQLLYTDRRFFDYGGHLDIYPMEELPFWRQHMQRRRRELEDDGWVDGYRQAIDHVWSEVTKRGPLFNRDVQGSRLVGSYRGRKDSGVALYFLWLTGVTMTHSRKGFERRYDLLSRIAPDALQGQADEAAVDAWSERSALQQAGLATPQEWAAAVRYRRRGGTWSPAERASAVQLLIKRGQAEVVRIREMPGTYLVPAEATVLLEELARGAVPAAWTPTGGAQKPSMVFLSPLDNVLHNRKRTLALFDFDYLWEIYTRADKRRYGPYTLPILYDDRLVGRIDLRLDRPKQCLVVNGVWWEKPAEARGKTFQSAYRQSLEEFVIAHQANGVRHCQA